MRLIDADALLEQIGIDSDGSPGYYGDTWQFIKTIENAPTLDMTSEWIPCSESLPNEGELVLVSNPYISGVGYYRNRHWYIANNVSWDAWNTTDVVAWMPLPKPYKEREGE